MSISGSVSTNKTWSITGTSSGLGRIMTERLLDRGVRVAATVRRDDALADLQKKHLERLSVMKLDLTDSTGIRATVDQAFDAWVGSMSLSATQPTAWSEQPRS
jgi:NADP-dependent 3-hydroxy acid dehydrogenase YdfG